MADFKFCFGGEDRDAAEQNNEEDVKVEACAQLLQLEHGPTESEADTVNVEWEDGALVLKKVHINSTVAAEELGLKEVHISDIVPGRYEGGFKLWEGAFDLVSHLCNEYEGPWRSNGKSASHDSRSLKGKFVLELGCGHGLPGITCVLAGAASVVFHDLNAEVLKMATAPNVQANLGSLESAKFVDGDFKSAAKVVCDHVGGPKFSVILTAESIYNHHSAKDLLEALDMCLEAEGKALVAAKSYYFGVGGSVASFKSLIDVDSRFYWTVAKRIDDSSCVREILFLARNPHVIRS